MDYQEAYDVTFQEVNYLSEECEISSKIVDAVTKDDPEFVEEHEDNPNGLPSDNWVVVEFFPETSIQKQQIFNAEHRLIEKGICFDTGGGGYLREWMLDYSFSFGNDESDLQSTDHIGEGRAEEAWTLVETLAG